MVAWLATRPRHLPPPCRHQALHRRSVQRDRGDHGQGLYAVPGVLRAFWQGPRRASRAAPGGGDGGQARACALAVVRGALRGYTGAIRPALPHCRPQFSLGALPISRLVPGALPLRKTAPRCAQASARQVGATAGRHGFGRGGARVCSGQRETCQGSVSGCCGAWRGGRNLVCQESTAGASPQAPPAPATCPQAAPPA